MKIILFLTTFTYIFLISSAQKYELSSPDGKLKAEIEIEEGISAYLTKEGKTAVTLENIGIESGKDVQLFSELKVQKVVRNSVNETVTPVIREKAALLTNSYNEIEIRFKTGSGITFRLFNDGLAYHVSTSAKDSLLIYKENLDSFEAMVKIIIFSKKNIGKLLQV